MGCGGSRDKNITGKDFEFKFNATEIADVDAKQNDVKTQVDALNKIRAGVFGNQATFNEKIGLKEGDAFQSMVLGIKAAFLIQGLPVEVETGKEPYSIKAKAALDKLTAEDKEAYGLFVSYQAAIGTAEKDLDAVVKAVTEAQTAFNKAVEEAEKAATKDKPIAEKQTTAIAEARKAIEAALARANDLKAAVKEEYSDFAGSQLENAAKENKDLSEKVKADFKDKPATLKEVVAKNYF